MSFLQGRLGTYLRGPGDVPPLRKLREFREFEPDGTLLSPAGLRMRGVLPCTAGGVCSPKGNILRIRLFFVLLGFLGRACPSLYGEDDLPIRIGQDERCCRSRQQRLSPPVQSSLQRVSCLPGRSA